MKIETSGVVGLLREFFKAGYRVGRPEGWFYDPEWCEAEFRRYMAEAHEVIELEFRGKGGG